VTDQLSPEDWSKFEIVVRKKWAYCGGIGELYLNAIRMILKEIPVWFDTQKSFDLALRICCIPGEVDLVQPLLSHTPDERALEYACECGNTEIVKMLLKDGRSFAQFALESAISAEHDDIVKLLLQDPRTNPNEGLREAIRENSVPI
jgi:hypothetical protein